ncbi:MAG: BatD family protein, partial [Fuerstia sp.]|nr:BatD family protein [Fuerstiella sp.]
DVQIVIDYPTELGKARDPFAGFLEDSGFGSRSPLSQMMGDDFFSSPFSNRLTVSKTRPITGEAQVDATEVLPVPTEGRPADYRGAVGRYKIVTLATPTAVSAGDPITLNIGIEGTGPMDLVQAPPLSELPTLTADFKVADQSLAGFVQDTTKLFSTTIRPRREGITQIPAIPFSFFDPDTGKFETAMSDPIAITVDKSESLSLDAIVGRQRQSGDSPKDTASASRQMAAEFTNDNSAAALVQQAPASPGEWWWFFVFAPPVAWLATAIVCNRAIIGSRLSGFRSAKTRCLTAIERANESSEVVTALTRFIESRTRQACSTATIAIGALRTSGMMQAAIDVEAFFQRCEQSQFGGSSQQSLADCRREAKALVDRIESSVNSIGKSQVRRTKRTSTSRASTARNISSAAHRVPILIIAAVFASSTSDAIMAADSSPLETPVSTATEQRQDVVELSTAQQQTVLTEAGDLYSRGTGVAKTDSADAVDLFTAAAQKYQLLVDSGIHNARLYRNLGNACLQSNQPGRAIANYERARQLDPADRQLIVNLAFANSLIKGGESETNNATVTAGDPMSLKSMVEKIRTSNALLIDLIGMHMITWTLVISSVVFWSLQISRAAGYRFPVWRFAIVPLLLLTTSLTSAVLASTQPRSTNNGIIVANNTTLHSGDGGQFDAVLSLDAAQGQRVEILTTRGEWAQVRTRHGHIGWLPARDVEKL